jgi:hypothetical protein
MYPLTGKRQLAMFKRKQPNDVLFLMPVRLASKKKPPGGAIMLCCDTAGKLCSLVVSRSVYQRARASAESMEHHQKPFAVLGLESTPGRFVPVAVEIGPQEIWALEHILEHALKSGNLPDLLRRYLKPIIRLGESHRSAVVSEQRKRRPQATPRVLDRLPYYPEHDMEVSMPIYKAEYSYPLVPLKRLPPDENTPRNTHRFLILDSAGDLGYVTVPLNLTRQMELELLHQGTRKRRYTTALITKYQEDIAIQYMSISQQQQKALNTITRYFEETGNGKRPISAAARTVLVRARDKASSPAD